jgi:sortase A
MVVAGVAAAAWVAVVWFWKDPFTMLYTTWEQHKLADRYDERVRAWHTSVSHPSARTVRRRLAAEARRYRLSSRRGDAIGRIEVPRIGVDMVLVNGTDESSLEKGPGRDLRTYMPGEGRLVYIAGHRTTFAAPFADIERLRPGDTITIEVPYGTFRYVVTRHVIVPADDLSRLRSPRHEVVALQACHPRFFASQRYIVYGKPAWVRLRSGRRYDLR